MVFPFRTWNLSRLASSVASVTFCLIGSGRFLKASSVGPNTVKGPVERQYKDFISIMLSL